MGRVPHQGFKKALAALCLLIPVMNSFAQQRPQFTQYMFNNLVINPAYAGVDEALSLTFIHRSQWTGIENSPSTQTFSGHTQFADIHTGMGLTVMNDRIGVHRNLNALINYAHHVKTYDKCFLSMGLQAGIHSQKADFLSLAGSTYDPTLLNASVSYTSLDFGAGLYFRSPALHAGLSATNLIPETVYLNDSISLHIRNANIFGFLKYKIRVNESIEAEPSVLLKHLAGVPVSYDMNMNLIWRKVLTTGISYRKKESVALLLKAQMTRQLQFGYAFDYPIGVVTRVSNGSHEVVIHYLFKYVRKKVRSFR